MRSNAASFFAEYFRQLTGYPTYPWQKKLFAAFIEAQALPWPEVLDLPTGAGKTSVVYVWLLALAWNIRAGASGIPRRLAWIVNRRVVVDQISAELEQIRARLESPENADLKQLLTSVSTSNIPFAISTLRGEFADNGDWRRDPSTPAVIVGTVDMIGSRLLFRGYRSSRYFRPLHAGLLGVDALIVNDESHLSPAFASLLARLRDLKPAAHIADKQFRVLLLSATHGALNGLRRFEHEPAEDVAESDQFRAIFLAPKSLTLHVVGSLNELDAVAWQLATASPLPRTAIFIEQPEKAAKWAERFRKENRPCALLTGTMRGFERDRLFQNPTFLRFLDRQPGTEPVWLICTSAGEVGINFSCERMITGIAEADHLLQRFGRLNRFGSTVPGDGHLVFREPAEKERTHRNAIAYFRGLAGDISCASVWANRPPENACSERPLLARLEDRHIDIWSQTTFRDNAVPAVASWLHGKQEPDVPETEVAWRSDVELLTSWSVGVDQIRQVLEYYPLLTREKLHEPAVRVAKKLAEIRERIGLAESSQKRIIVVESDGAVSVRDLAWLVTQTEKDPLYLGYKLLLLPEGLGSVPGGMFSSAGQDEVAQTLDVADPEQDGMPARVRFLFSAGTFSVMTSAGISDHVTPPASLDRSNLSEFATGRYRFPLLVSHPDDDDLALAYFGLRLRALAANAKDVALTEHQASVAARARALVCALGLTDLGQTYEGTGAIHDSGKHRVVWQRAMRGSMENPIAKSRAPVNLRLINHYRHELGSLLDALARKDGPIDDLMLHLVASHHAGARPFFETSQYDPQNLRQSERECAEVARRYARLQVKYGPWGLAYLEAIFKCADGLVSASEGEPASA